MENKPDDVKAEEENLPLTSNTEPKEKKNTKPRKLKINYACMCLFAFLTGVDFAVIIPTLWDRLHLDFNASGSFMGLVISSYSFSGVICGLIMGKLSDEINKTKPFYLIAITLSVFGHLLYFTGINKFVILGARAISGLCLGASPVALAYVAKTTDEKERISVISIIMATRQLGLMFGPAFNIFLRKTNYVLFDKFIIDRKSSPGLFMALLWTICFFVMLTIYHDFKYSPKPNTKAEIEMTELSQSAENNESSKQDEFKPTFSFYKKEFLRVDVFVLLATTFFTYFNQTSLETIVIPFTELMYGWNELQNSILFCIGGSIIIISYILIRLLSIKFKDRFILLLGLILIFLGLLIGCSCLPFAKQLRNPDLQISLYKSKYNKSINETSLASLNDTAELKSGTNKTILNKELAYDYQFFPAFVLFVLLDVLGLPMIAICSSSLFTKMIDNKAQGFGQGIQRGVLGFGTIFGPLCAGPFVQKPIYLLACTLTFITFIILFVLLSFKRLIPKEPIKKQLES